MALAGTLALPTGLGSYGTDYGGTFILTISILPMLGLHRLHANLVYRPNSQPQLRLEEGELRPQRPGLLGAAGGLLGPHPDADAAHAGFRARAAALVRAVRFGY